MTTPAELVRPEILALKAYHVAEAAGLVKLDAMENPYPLPEPLRRELADVLSQAPLNRYPDPSGAKLRELLKRKMNVPAGFELMLGNGSDELLQIAVTALSRAGATMMFPAPTFVMYSMYAAFTGMKALAMPLRADFSFDAAAFIARMNQERPALVFIAYPNNPSGLLYPEEDVASVIRAAPGLVVIDEAYHAFAERTFMSRLPEFPNLLVLRTVSKLGLAGIRLGYLAGAADWLDQLNKVRSPYNVNALTQAAAGFLLERLDVLEAQAAQIRAERERLGAALRTLPGAEVFPSQANFILLRVPDAEGAHAGLVRRGVLVKNLNAPATRNCLRVTVGTPEENRILIAALRECLQT
jgi:histidinol-phosphate aminotransferase